jgi:putative endonuclease
MAAMMTNPARYASGVLYVGVTPCPARQGEAYRRIHQNYGVTRLVYFEPHSQIKAGIRREKQIKSWRREKKFALSRRMNATFRDLREDFASTCGANRWRFCRDSSTSARKRREPPFGMTTAR